MPIRCKHRKSTIVTVGGIRVKAFTLPAPFYNGEFEKQFTFRPPTLPSDWEESFVKQEKHIVFLNTTITKGANCSRLTCDSVHNL